MINNGDAEGDDLSSFPVSWDGPNNGDTANDKPEIVGGGVDGSKCFKVVSYENPTQTWHTQFYIKSDEVLPQGTKWKLVMSVKADNEAVITTSAQAQPRAWKGSFINEFNVGTEWKEYSWTGEIGVADFQSIAFDLNNQRDDDGNLSPGNGGCAFYFDNIQFGVDLGGSNPMNDLACTYGADVIRVNLNDNTNMKDLVKAAGGETLIFDNSCATVSWNGKNCNIISVEGRPDGNLYFFLLDMDGEGGMDFDDEEAEVIIGFTNPTDAAHHLTFKEGKWAGEAVPDFSGIACDFDFVLGEGEYYSYLWGSPKLEAAEPEAGSFNLAADTKEFKITFNQRVDASTIVAKLGNESLTVTPAEGEAKEVTLTRTGSDALAGVYQLVISKAVGEKGMDLDENIVIDYSFGPVTIDPNDQPKDIIPLAYFNETAEGGIPVGFTVSVDNDAEIRKAPDTFGSGPRTFAFGEGGDFTRGLYTRNSWIEFGKEEGYELALEEGKKYTISFNTARWKSSGQWFKFEVINPNEETELSALIENNPDVNGSKNAVSGSTSYTESFFAGMTGNYTLKWSVTNASGDVQTGGYVEAILANVLLKYVPNVLGAEEMTTLSEALANAKSTLEGNSDDRFSGPAFDALKAVIEKTDAEMANYTAPSVYAAATAALNDAAQAMKDHRSLIDAYDPLPQEALDVVNQYAESKFAVTDIYKNLQALVDKYGEKTTQTVTDPETGEEYEQVTLAIKQLKDDAELTAAVAELKEAIALAIGRGDVARSGKGMFTVGEPKMGDWEATCTGIAVLVDRIRHGVIALQSLGVAADDELLVTANNALTDNDVVVDALKARITTELYGQLKNADNELFKATEEGGEEVATTYDMTVFVKNPSIYNLNPTASYAPENVPGWDVTDFRGFSTGWSDLGTANVPVKIMFSNWSGSFTVSQTVEDLPAGVYSLVAGFGERDNEVGLDGSYLFAKTTAADTLTAQMTMVGQAFPVDNVTIEDIVVTDGTLALGVQASQESKAFFNGVKLFMTAPAAGFDYGKAYEEVLAGIDETVAQPAQVRAIQLFDLNGRQVLKAQKGITIVRKMMNDGTIRTEKVVVK